MRTHKTIEERAMRHLEDNKKPEAKELPIEMPVHSEKDNNQVEDDTDDTQLKEDAKSVIIKSTD